jgi:hypothetical protein
MDPLSEREAESSTHSPEPWRSEGRYIRDFRGAIVVRGKTVADARRIAAAINATRDIPTEALERWLVQDVSDPNTRPDLEIDLESTRRRAERRRNERRAPDSMAGPVALVFDRRVMERRLSQRRSA